MGSKKFDETPATETETPSTDTESTTPESSTEGDAPAISEGDVTSEPTSTEVAE